MNSTELSNENSKLERLLAERKRRRRIKLRTMIQEAKRRKMLTPNIITAYAELHLVDDDGQPIRPAAHHRLWLQLLCDERIKKLLIIAPPESAKTTWSISAYLGCRLGVFPEQSIIIGSASGAVAEKRSLSLRTMTGNADWQTTFPGLARAEGMKWDPLEWSIAPDGKPFSGRLHPTVAAYGTGGAITGSRADLVLADDLLDFENSRTAHQRGLVEQWLHNSLLSRRKSRTGRAIVIGTAWHPSDIYAKARQEGGWVVCHTPLLAVGTMFYANLSYPDDWPYEMIGEPVAGATSPTA